MKSYSSYPLVLGLVLALLAGRTLVAEETSPAPTAAPSTAPAAAAVPEVSKPEAPKDEPVTGPQATLKEQMVNLFELSKKTSAPGAEGVKARQAINTWVDWERISNDCVGHTAWRKQPVAKQTEFKTLLREVIEKTAYARLEKFWKGATYRFEKIGIKGNEADVPVKFIVDGKAFLLEYYLNAKGSRWLLHDIAYEGERYSENIHEQIDAFLREKPFKDLLDKLRKRRDELDSDKRG